jgi:LCP family protein required for cell wall assembly
LAEKNTNDNQNSKKKHKWIGIFLIALLLLFIGLAGYYLERDLEPVPDNQIEDSQVLEEDTDSTESSEEASINGDQSESSVSEEDLETEEVAETEEMSDSEEETATSDMGAEGSETAEQAEEELSKEDMGEEELGGEDSAADIENGIDDQSSVEDSIAEENGTNVQQSQETDSETDSETKSDIESDIDQEGVAPQDSDINQEDSDSLEPIEESSSQSEAELDQEDQLESEAGEDFSQELEDPSLLDRILSILGLADSDFSQDLDILFVGLDDEESVALGTIEADSIMLAKLRPEINKLQLKHIDEDTIYKGQPLRDYHNGDIQLAVEEITEDKIDYYVYVNYQGFEKVIDELGGVQITLEKEVKVPGLGLNLKAGDNLLSGKEALNFVRWRDSNSIARFERQKILINSVVTKLKSNNILFNVKELYSTIVESYNSIETDINPVLAAEIFNYLRDNAQLELEFIE